MICICPYIPFSLGRSLRDLYLAFPLIATLSRADLKTRYQQSLIGIVWNLVQPLAMMVVFSFVFRFVARIEKLNIPYPLFVYSGMILWQFFQKTIENSTRIYTQYAGLLTKFHVPRLAFPYIALASAFLDFVLSFFVLGLLMVVFQVPFLGSLVYLPLVILLTAALGVSVGSFLAPWNTLYRDISLALPFLLQIIMFTSPVLYYIPVFKGTWFILYALNPVATLVDAYRWCLFGIGAWPPLSCWMFLGIYLSLFFPLGLWTIHRMESKILDHV